MGIALSRPIYVELLCVGASLLAVALAFPVQEVQLTAAFVFLCFTLLPADLGPMAMIFGSEPPPKFRTIPKSEFCPEWEDVLGEENLKKTGDNYLVVGGAGFVGRRVVHALVTRGETVSVLDFEPEGLAALAKDYPTVRLYVGDVTKEADCKRAVKGIDTIYAVFAVIKFQDAYEKQYARSYRVNVQGTKNLLDAALEAGVKRYVLTSTSHVTLTNKWAIMPEGFDESSPYATRGNHFNNYGISKAECEKLVLSYNGKKNSSGDLFSTGSVRPSSQVYGYPDKLPLFGGAIKSGQYLCLQPDHWADNVTADSIVLAELLLEGELRRKGSQGPAAGQAFNISGGRTMTDREMGSLMELHSIRELGKRIKVVRPPLRFILLLCPIVDFIIWIMPGLSYETVFGTSLTTFVGGCAILNATAINNLKSMDKAERLLGYKTHLSPSEGVRRAMREYKLGRIIQSEAEWKASEKEVVVTKVFEALN